MVRNFFLGKKCDCCGPRHFHRSDVVNQKPDNLHGRNKNLLHSTSEIQHFQISFFSRQFQSFRGAPQLSHIYFGWHGFGNQQNTSDKELRTHFNASTCLTWVVVPSLSLRQTVKQKCPPTCLRGRSRKQSNERLVAIQTLSEKPRSNIP